MKYVRISNVVARQCPFTHGFSEGEVVSFISVHMCARLNYYFCMHICCLHLHLRMYIYNHTKTTCTNLWIVIF